MDCLSSKYGSWKNIKLNQIQTSLSWILSIHHFDADVKCAIQLMWPTATTNVIKTRVKMTKIRVASVAIWICVLYASSQRNNFHKIYHFVTLLLLSLCLCFDVSRWRQMPKKKIQHKTAHGLNPIAVKPGSILRMNAAAFYLLKTLKFAEMSPMRSSLGFHFNRQHMNECVDLMESTDKCRWQP